MLDGFWIYLVKEFYQFGYRYYMQVFDLRIRGFDVVGSFVKDICVFEGQILVKYIMWMIQRIFQLGGQWYDFFTLVTWLGRGCFVGERRGVQVLRGYFRFVFSLELDFIIVYIGYSIDVVQYWETDEICRVKDVQKFS